MQSLAAIVQVHALQIWGRRVTDCETESQVAVDLESPVIKVKNDLQVWCIVCAGPWVEVNVPLAENLFRASMEGGQ